MKIANEGTEDWIRNKRKLMQNKRKEIGEFFRYVLISPIFVLNFLLVLQFASSCFFFFQIVVLFSEIERDPEYC